MSDDNKEGAAEQCQLCGGSAGHWEGCKAPNCPAPPAVMPAAPSDAATNLSNLLARIHRDGGHYEGEHGTAKAFYDADCKVVEWLARDDAALSQTMQPQAGRFCNKCGYFGPDELHQRPNVSGQCGYLSTKAKPATPGDAVAREFTNELGNRIRITIEGPASVSENVVTPMEAEQLGGALNDFAASEVSPVATGEQAGAVAVLRFERGTPGRENDMPRVVSCNWQPDGEYPVYLAAPGAAIAAREQGDA